MDWNSSGRWQRNRGNGWIIAAVVIGLIILTNGWILLIPLMGLAAFAFFGFVLPKLAWHAHQGGWHQRDWSCMGEKHKREFRQWNSMGYGEKPKRDRRDEIEYV